MTLSAPDLYRRHVYAGLGARYDGETKGNLMQLKHWYKATYLRTITSPEKTHYRFSAWNWREAIELALAARPTGAVMVRLDQEQEA
jgi:hypothetical protein